MGDVYENRIAVALKRIEACPAHHFEPYLITRTPYSKALRTFERCRCGRMVLRITTADDLLTLAQVTQTIPQDASTQGLLAFAQMTKKA